MYSGRICACGTDKILAWNERVREDENCDDKDDKQTDVCDKR